MHSSSGGLFTMQEPVPISPCFQGIERVNIGECLFFNDQV